jgi:hypothetical protein
MAAPEEGLALSAARALALAGQWELTDALLASAQASGRTGQVALALARAQVAVELKQWRGTGDPAPAVDAAAALIGAAGSSDEAFDLALLRLFGDYWAELVPGGAISPPAGPGGRDPGLLDDLRDRAARLISAAPDPQARRQGCLLRRADRRQSARRAGMRGAVVRRGTGRMPARNRRRRRFRSPAVSGRLSPGGKGACGGVPALADELSDGDIRLFACDARG